MGGVRFLIAVMISKQISDFWTQISADFIWFHHSVYEISTVASPSYPTENGCQESSWVDRSVQGPACF